MCLDLMLHLDKKKLPPIEQQNLQFVNENDKMGINREKENDSKEHTETDNITHKPPSR